MTPRRGTKRTDIDRSAGADDALRTDRDAERFVEGLEDGVFSDQLSRALRDDDGLPDLTERILHETGRRRGWLGRHGRMIVRGAQISAAMAVVGVAAAVFTARSAPPPVRSVDEAPVSALAGALPGEARQAITRVQEAVSLRSAVGSEAVHVEWRGRLASSNSVRAHLSPTDVMRRLSGERVADGDGVGARVALMPASDAAAFSSLGSADSYSGLLADSEIDAPVSVLSSEERSALARALAVDPSQLIVLNEQVFVKDAVSGTVRLVNPGTPVMIRTGETQTLPVEYRGLMTIIEAPASGR